MGFDFKCLKFCWENEKGKYLMEYAGLHNLTSDIFMSTLMVVLWVVTPCGLVGNHPQSTYSQP